MGAAAPSTLKELAGNGRDGAGMKSRDMEGNEKEMEGN